MQITCYIYLAISAKSCHSSILYYNVVPMVWLHDEISDAVLVATKDMRPSNMI